MTAPTTTTATTEERPPQPEVVIEKGPTTVSITPKATTPQPSIIGIVYVSVASVQGIVQQLSRAEAQLSQLIQQLRPWVRWVIADSEEGSRAFTISAIQECISAVDAHIDAFEEQVQKRLAEA